MTRHRYGFRNYVASFQQHNGNVDDHGTPTYSIDLDWVTVVPEWPVEKVAASGGEILRGRQIAASTTHVLYGEYFSSDGITPEQRCVIDGEIYQIVSVMDLEGRNRERRVELRRED